MFTARKNSKLEEQPIEKVWLRPEGSLRSELGWEITPFPQMIGRSPGCPIRIGDATVSREHAMVWMKEDMPFMRDLGSQNGTRVNGKRVVECVMTAGDLIQLGHISLRLCFGPTPNSDRVALEHPVAPEIGRAHV